MYYLQTKRPLHYLMKLKYIRIILTLPPRVEGSCMFKLFQKSKNKDVERPLVNIPANWWIDGTSKTQTRPMETHSLTKYKFISTCLVV